MVIRVTTKIPITLDIEIKISEAIKRVLEEDCEVEIVAD